MNHSGAHVACWPAVCGMAAPPFFWATIVMVSLLTADYSHVSQTVSRLATTDRPYADMLRIGMIVYGLLIYPLAYGLYRGLGRGTGGALVWIALMVYGTGIILAGFFRADSVLPLTPEARVHLRAGQTAFLAIMTTTLLVPFVSRTDRRWRAFIPFSLAIALLTVLFAIPFQSGAWPEIRGLWQRGFFVTTTLWVEVVSLMLLRQELENGRQLGHPTVTHPVKEG